jgi:hypothetical protein
MNREAIPQRSRTVGIETRLFHQELNKLLGELLDRHPQHKFDVLMAFYIPGGTDLVTTKYHLQLALPESNELIGFKRFRSSLLPVSHQSGVNPDKICIISNLSELAIYRFAKSQ